MIFRMFVKSLGEMQNGMISYILMLPMYQIMKNGKCRWIEIITCDKKTKKNRKKFSIFPQNWINITTTGCAACSFGITWHFVVWRFKNALVLFILLGVTGLMYETQMTNKSSLKYWLTSTASLSKLFLLANWYRTWHQCLNVSGWMSNLEVFCDLDARACCTPSSVKLKISDRLISSLIFCKFGSWTPAWALCIGTISKLVSEVLVIWFRAVVSVLLCMLWNWLSLSDEEPEIGTAVFAETASSGPKQSVFKKSNRVNGASWKPANSFPVVSLFDVVRVSKIWGLGGTGILIRDEDALWPPTPPWRVCNASWLRRALTHRKGTLQNLHW